MTEYFVAFIFFTFGLIFMALTLHFSRYKKRGAGCCGRAFDEPGLGAGCDTCPKR